jgi:cystathionine beta-lyase/cystathionine gamma-synthase
MKTLALRMERHSVNAVCAAEFLAAHPGVARVYYAGLAGDAEHERACRMLPDGAGGMLSFELAGGAAAVDRFIGGLTMIRFAPSLADVSTTVSYPATTSHRGLAAAERERLGITDGLVRLSAGIESADDIVRDLERGLAAV